MKFESEAFWVHGYWDFGGLNGGLRPDRPTQRIPRGQTLLAARYQRMPPGSSQPAAVRIPNDREIPRLQELRARR